MAVIRINYKQKLEGKPNWFQRQISLFVYFGHYFGHYMGKKYRFLNGYWYKCSIGLKH